MSVLSVVYGKRRGKFLFRLAASKRSSVEKSSNKGTEAVEKLLAGWEKTQEVEVELRFKFQFCQMLYLELTLKYKVLKRPFVGKVEKNDTAKSFTAQHLIHCQLVVRL